MRPGSCVRLAVAAALAAGAASQASAHRRDEQLQAARIAIEPNRVTVDLDITPGAELAAGAIAAIDHDRDGALSPAEQDAYARGVAGALWLANDREAHELKVVSATFPDLPAMRRGEGTIAMRLQAALRPDNDGSHELMFRNGHDAAKSVYLANALVPHDARVTVGTQRRSATQHELTIAYTVAAATRSGRKAAVMLLLTTSVIAVFVPVVVLLSRRTRRRAEPVRPESSAACGRCPR
jgi:hypothetical protein